LTDRPTDRPTDATARVDAFDASDDVARRRRRSRRTSRPVDARAVADVDVVSRATTTSRSRFRVSIANRHVHESRVPTHRRVGSMYDELP